MENHELFHLRELETMAGDDISFIIKMLDTFSLTVPPFIEQMKAALEAKDLPELTKIAHRLKPSFHYLGRTDLYQLLAVIENGDGSHSEAEVHSAANSFIPAVHPMIMAVDEHLEQLKKA